VYYPNIMGYAQGALGLASNNGAAVSPTYPPTTPAALDQFSQIMKAIGHGIGAVAAHETGHQLLLPHMDCSGPNTSVKCSPINIYQNYASDDNNDFFYVDTPGNEIHWDTDGVCAINYYLLNGRNALKDGKCQ
jgi:hypothetical protein